MVAGGPTAEAAAPGEAPLTLVITLSGGVLPAGDTGGGTAPIGAPEPPVAATTPFAAPGAVETGQLVVMTSVRSDGGNEVTAGNPFFQTPPTEGDAGPAVEQLLREIDLYQLPDQPRPDDPLSRRATPEFPQVELVTALAIDGEGKKAAAAIEIGDARAWGWPAEAPPAHSGGKAEPCDAVPPDDASFTSVSRALLAGFTLPGLILSVRRRPARPARPKLSDPGGCC